MTKLKVINVGPIEWFSPHFVYDDEHITAYTYDPFKSDKTLVFYCNEIKPDILFIFRGDLVREQLVDLRNIYQVEFSSEIYPTNIFSLSHAQRVSVGKFMHCFKNLNPYKNIYHYDESRKLLFDALGLPMKYRFLPVNISPFKNINNQEKDIDLLFFGRSSDRRQNIFNQLKEKGLKFVWIENGLDWYELSNYISRAKVVINITGEDIDNFEPRIQLALAGGSCVITESSIGLNCFLSKYKSQKEKVRIVKLEARNILDAYYYFYHNDFFKDKHMRNYYLSSNKFLLSEINS